jgi:hypothetical protein
MAALDFALNPLRGSTPLWKIALLYSIVGGAVFQVIAMIVAPAPGGGRQVLALAALAYGTYVTVATYRCALNCPWPTLGRFVRLCAALSLLVVPFVAYLIFSGGAAFAT